MTLISVMALILRYFTECRHAVNAMMFAKWPVSAVKMHTIYYYRSSIKSFNQHEPSEISADKRSEPRCQISWNAHFGACPHWLLESLALSGTSVDMGTASYLARWHVGRTPQNRLTPSRCCVPRDRTLLVETTSCLLQCSHRTLRPNDLDLHTGTGNQSINIESNRSINQSIGQSIGQ